MTKAILELNWIGEIHNSKDMNWKMLNLFFYTTERKCETIDLSLFKKVLRKILFALAFRYFQEEGSSSANDSSTHNTS